MNNNMLGIYIHIPFCLKKCSYCDFNSSDSLNHLKRDYITALINEINNSDITDPTDSVFIGGGTPSSIETPLLIAVISAVKGKFPHGNLEFTVEVNPATLSLDGFCTLRAAGVNRISFGLQSAIDDELKTLGRIHSYADFLASYQNARRAGFDNINVDLMFSLPDQTLEKWQYTLDTVLDVKPEHLSCYSLIIEQGTPFYDMKLNLPDDETDRAIYEFTVNHLTNNGYKHYEISNFALPNKECRHNIKYWQRENYLGFGTGAASLYGNMRCQNSSDIQIYIDSNVKSAEMLSRHDIINEHIFLRLRMIEGIDLAEFKSTFGFDFLQRYSEIISKYEKSGLISVDTHCRLTLDGISVSNTIMSDFLI